jgi:hypothetical protein
MKVKPISSYQGQLRFESMLIHAPRMISLYTDLAYQVEQENRHLVVFNVPRTATGQVNWKLIRAIDTMIQANTGPE